MLRAALLVVLALQLEGCSALASKEAAVGCQVADFVSTRYALAHGAKEANPIVAGVLDKLGWGGFFLLKAAVVVALLRYHDEIPQAARATLNGATCAVAANNIAVGIQLSK